MWGLRGMIALLMSLLATGCLIFLEKEVGIVPESVKKDQRARQREYSPNNCPPGTQWSKIAHCTRTDAGALECKGGCVESP